MRTTLSLLTLASTALLASAVPAHNHPSHHSKDVNTEGGGACPLLTTANLNKERAALKRAGDPGIIPLVVDDYQPKTVIGFFQNDQNVKFGQELSPLQTVGEPKVFFPRPRGDSAETTYTLIIHDPDAPAPLGAPQFLHWVKTGLTPSCEAQKPASDGGETRRMYVFPTPPPLSGEHRYITTILREPKGYQPPNELDLLLHLIQFDIRKYIKLTGAQPVGQFYYNASVLPEPQLTGGSPPGPLAGPNIPGDESFLTALLNGDAL